MAKSSVVSVDKTVDIRTWQAAEIKVGLAELDRGEGVSHDKVVAWIESWDSDDRQPRPTAGKT